MYDRFRITFDDTTSKAMLRLFADSLDRLSKGKERLRISDLPTISQR
jgi:hypothetical protein